MASSQSFIIGLPSKTSKYPLRPVSPRERERKGRIEEWRNRGIEEMGERSEGRGETSVDPNTERERRELEYQAEY